MENSDINKNDSVILTPAERMYLNHLRNVKNYQSRNPEKIKQKNKKYNENLKNENPEKYKEMLEKKKEYYKNVIKPKLEKMKMSG